MTTAALEALWLARTHCKLKGSPRGMADGITVIGIALPDAAVVWLPQLERAAV